MLKEAKVLHDSIKDHYLELLPLLESLEKKTQGDLQTYGAQQVDTAYACRTAIEVLDELRKRINRVYTVAQTVASIQMTALDQQRISTLHATATSAPKIWYKIVTKRDNDPKRHDALLQFLGVPQKTAEKELVRIHPPKFAEHVADLVGDGKDLPFDPKDLTGTDLCLRITKKKDI